jgi:hypothetical protein
MLTHDPEAVRAVDALITANQHIYGADDLALTIIPALMAFTGMAVILALSGKQFVNAMREEGSPNSLFMKVVGLFFHFILVQTLALIVALLSRTYVSSDWLAGFAFLLSAYGSPRRFQSRRCCSTFHGYTTSQDRAMTTLREAR